MGPSPPYPTTDIVSGLDKELILFSIRKSCILAFMGKIFTNPNQLEEWVAAAEEIQDGYGMEKALGYLMGKNFFYAEAKDVLIFGEMMEYFRD